MAFLLHVGTAMAIPAYPGIRKTTQPDGSSVTLRLLGDEYLHYTTTDDGFSVVKDQRGYYVYAQLNDGKLAPTTCIAHDEAMRSAQERTFLQGVKKYLVPTMSAVAATELKAERARQAARIQKQRVQQYDYTKFRGLILLIEYNDCPFKYDNYQQLMDEMVNQDNYRGNNITNVTRTEGVFTGSVRDFYRDSSNGLFVPQFDVVGPIQVNRSMYFSGSEPDANNRWGDNTPYLTYDAIMAADEMVDFSQYDGDGDGFVDMVYLVFSGMSSNYSGNDERLLWPHASQLFNPNNGRYLSRDGVYLGRYACSTEIYGWESWNTLNGIGTICHEFGHVLGLPDFYDTDYEKSGGESNHPGEWTVMAGGGYLNYGRNPATYTLFERYALGWATPQVISEEGSFTLESLENSNTGYRINSQTANEYFLFENRQQTKWNKYLPGHGMLVFRVDSTNAQVWANNTINNNPKHNYFELVRAGGLRDYNETDSDPFPGSAHVTMLNNTTSPANLLSWSGKETLWGIENIVESRQGVITFDIIDVNLLRSISLPESLIIGIGTSRKLEETRYPDYAPYILEWKSDNEAVVTITSDGVVTGMSEGTAIITVTGRSPKQKPEDAVSATCLITVEDQPVANNIQEFRQLDEQAQSALLLSNAQVLYNNKGTFYVRDASSSIVISGISASWARNSLLNGTLYGTRLTVNGMPTFSPNEKTDLSGVQSTSGTTATPVTKNVDEVTEADYANMLTLTKTKMIVGSSGVYAVKGDKQIRVYNTFGIKNLSTPKSFDGKRFEVTGILVTRQLNGELIDELALLSSIKEVEADYCTLTYKTMGEGYVLANNTLQLSGDGSQQFIEDDDVALQMIPAEGYVLKFAMLDNKELTPDEEQPTAFTLKNYNGSHILIVMFINEDESGIRQLTTPDQLTDATPVTVYTAGGLLVARTTIGSLRQLRLPAGIYTVKAPTHVFKLLAP